MDESDKLPPRLGAAMAWRFLSIATKMALQLVVIATLSRLLTVEAFGLVGQATLVMGFLGLFSEMGLTTALIQKAELSADDLAAANSLAILSGCAYTLGAWLTAPWVAALLGSPEVAPLLQWLSATFVVIAIGMPSSGLLHRRLAYRQLMFSDNLAFLLGYAGVGITAACLGAGPYALVAALLSQEVIRTIALCYLVPPGLKWQIRGPAVRQFLQLSSGMGGLRLGFHLARNLDYLIIARFLGADALGFYLRAYQIMQQPITTFAGVVNTTIFAAASRSQHDSKVLWKLCCTSLGANALILVPLLITFAAMAQEIISVLLGPQWDHSAAAFRWLCLGGIPLFMQNAIEAVLRANGVSRGRTILCGTYLTLIAAGSLIGMYWGISGVAVGVYIALSLQAVIAIAMASLAFESRWQQLSFAMWPAALAGILTLAIVWPLGDWLRACEVSAPLVLLGVIAAVGTAYVLLILCLPRSVIPAELTGIFDRIDGLLLRIKGVLRPKISTRVRTVS